MNIASITSPGCSSFSCTNTATVTTQSPESFVNNESITIAGTSITGYNKAWTITVVSPTQFTFAACQDFGTSCPAETGTANTGTAAGNANGYAAIKLTQAGLQ